MFWQKALWIITINGISLTCLEDDDFQTYNCYQNRMLEIQAMENNEMVDASYYEGLFFKEWLEKLKTHDINGLYTSLKRHGFNVEDVDFLEKLYNEINSSDWRSSSCGGCW